MEAILISYYFWTGLTLWLHCLNLVGWKLYRIQRLDLLKLNLECTSLISDLCSLFVASKPRSWKIKPLEVVFPPSGNITRPEEKYVQRFSSKSCNRCILFHVGKSYLKNVELVKQYIWGGESDRVGSDFLSANAGRVCSTFCRVG